VARGLPVVFTLRHLAYECDVPFTYIHDIVAQRIDPYKTFFIKKRSGGYRQITVPQFQLNKVQKWIHENILKKATAHPCATAYMVGCSPVRNARIHCNSNWLVKIDIERFFESISERQIYHVFRQMGYKALLAFEFSRLVTWHGELWWKKYRSKRWKRNPLRHSIEAYQSDHVGHLPQGTATSPILANLVCQSLDIELYKLAQEFGCAYSRYSDDIVFSTVDFTRSRAIELIGKSSQILSRGGFRRNIRKTHIITPGARKIVTGLLVDGAEPRITRELRNRIEVHLHFANKPGVGVAKHCRRRGFRSIIGFRNHLWGLINYAEQVNVNCQDYVSDFRKIEWPDF